MAWQIAKMDFPKLGNWKMMFLIYIFLVPVVFFYLLEGPWHICGGDSRCGCGGTTAGGAAWSASPQRLGMEEVPLDVLDTPSVTFRSFSPSKTLRRFLVPLNFLIFSRGCSLDILARGSSLKFAAFLPLCGRSIDLKSVASWVKRDILKQLYLA